jgi:hypothetical protein
MEEKKTEKIEELEEELILDEEVNPDEVKTMTVTIVVKSNIDRTSLREAVVDFLDDLTADSQIAGYDSVGVEVEE